MTSDLIDELKSSKEYREAFVASHISNGIAFQLRALREAEEWDQKELAAQMGKPSAQPMISRYENPDYGKYSLSSLLELANTFDVALVVKFAPFSELIEHDSKISQSTLNVPSFSEEVDAGSLDKCAENTINAQPVTSLTTGVLDFSDMTNTPWVNVAANTLVQFFEGARTQGPPFRTSYGATPYGMMDKVA